jgi:hypothetical protein
MPRHHSNFGDFSLTRELGEALRSQRERLREPLPRARLELLAKLDEPAPGNTPSPPTQPKQREDDDGA